MDAEIISVGDELLIGQVVNTNASFIGEILSSIGVRICRITTVGDDRQSIREAFESARLKHDLVLVTGGLGPTADDITRSVVTEFFNTRLVFSPTAFENVKRILGSRMMPVLDAHKGQAMVPEACSVLPNECGTAPGYYFNESSHHFFVMPGVPEEVKSMVQGQVVPILNGIMTEHRSSRTLLTTGIPESALEARISSVDFSRVEVAYLPSPAGVRLRFSTFASSRDAAEARVNQVCSEVMEHVGEYVFGEGTETLESIVGKLLTDGNATLATAESCSGGLMADKITNVPGCSRYFLAGMVAYSNKSKTDVLNVDPSLIERHGAVSAEVAAAMARGTRARFASTYAIATTGIAGPDGGTPEKPVGLVWIGLAAPEGVRVFRCHFGDIRWRTKLRAAQTGLDLLRRYLMGMPLTNTFITLTGDLQT